MNRFFSTIIDTIGASWVLITLAFRSRFNFRSNYWNWRMQTAFPDAQIPVGRLGKFRLSVEYARWAYRIRRLR